MHRHLKTAIPAAMLAASFFATGANAHISLEQGGTHLSRDGDQQLKAAPCGLAGSTRGTHIYTYAPGQTIDVSLVEYVPHPSYFRIAFDQDGDDGFKDPATILPIDPTRKCPDGPGDHCGASDYYNTPEVLPNMDYLNPHIPTDFSTPKYTWQVTFPDVECDNCTLQVIQVMEDDAFHGPYDPTPGVGVADVYHQCIDIVLKKDADGGVGSTSGGGGAGNGGGGAGSSTAGAGNGAASSSDSGGCSMTSSRGPNAPWGAAMVGLALAALRHRRRNR